MTNRRYDREREMNNSARRYGRYQEDRNMTDINRYNDGFNNKEDMNMTNNNRYSSERRISRRSDRAREITRAKGRKQNFVIASAAIALVAVIAASFIVFGAMGNNIKKSDTSPTTISVKSDKSDNKAAAQTSSQADQQTASAQTTAQPAVQQTSQQDDSQQDDSQQANTQTSVQSDDQSQDNSRSEDRIDTINGERVYIDTKRQAPDNTGTPLHIYENGKTSYGFDWTYDTDNSNFAIRCNYNFDEQQYDFILYGVTPGTSHVTLYYNTDDNTQVPEHLTINVDNNLNVTQG